VKRLLVPAGLSAFLPSMRRNTLHVLQILAGFLQQSCRLVAGWLQE
jgi:hypothetical protein